VTHSYDTSVVLPQLLFAEIRQKSGRRLEVCTVFPRLLFCQISCSNFWVDRTFQASAQTLFDIRLRPIFLQFHTSFFL